MNKTIQKPFCIAGVSGGPDSMAMLYGLCKRIVCVCHVNYRKRLSADRDQQYVTTYCKKHKIPLRILRVTPQVYKRYQHINNFQAKARAIRFDFFVKIAKQYRAKIILTAHNLNDFVETAIMQKQRKVDTLFLGIREISFYKRFVVFHPMLTFLKKELITYCDQLQIPYGIDETNFKDDYLRNRIRKVIDKWSKTKLLNEYKKIIRFNKVHDAKYKHVTKCFLTWVKQNFSIKYYFSIPKALKKHVIYMLLSYINNKRISSNKISLIDQFITKAKTNSKLRLSSDFYLLKTNTNIEAN